MQIKDIPLLILDGACGTNLQERGIPAEAWGPYEGCNEWLNLSAPEIIRGLHADFVAAGAQMLETNSFGASRIVLSEYGLEERVRELNFAAVTNARAAGTPDTFVAGSIGPGTKLPSLGHIGVDELAEAYREQMTALVEAGVDALIIETCQDLLQVKTAACCAFEILAETGRDIPVMVSVTVESTGTMLVGSDIAAVIATLAPFPIFSLGLNCATGPDDMESHLRLLQENWQTRISCIPNQGLPEVIDGKTCYPLSPAGYGKAMKRLVEEFGITVVGGCCGTTPEHIRALTEALQDAKIPTGREVAPTPTVASLYQSVSLQQPIPPLLIGERSNATGSKKFRELLLADDWEGCLDIARTQENNGAHILDLSTAYTGRNEKEDLTHLLRLSAAELKCPIMIDSTSADCVEACLKIYPGRSIINSINLEDGGTNARRLCKLAKKYGAAVVALTIDESGMAMTTDAKFAVARRIHSLAVGECGLQPSDLLFDCLTFTVGAGDETLYDAAVQTLGAIRRIKAELPGALTVLGLSNISFGLNRDSRRVLNSVFLHEAVEAGLDAAIVDVAKIIPLTRISEEDRDVCLDLLFDRNRNNDDTPLMRFIAHFEQQTTTADESGEKADETLEEQLRDRVKNGNKNELEDLLQMLLVRHLPGEIINDILIPAMREVGELFGRGEILLPFVLKSAEVMKAAVQLLDPFMKRGGEVERPFSVLLATVQGDVHDIGKNLVEIILSNNGYKVHDLGIKVPAETIIAKARELDVDVIGLSGLLVKSAIIMRDSLPHFQAAGLTQPVLLGGAALTARFVAESATAYQAPTVYCKDAFAGLKAVREAEAGILQSTTFTPRSHPEAEAETGEQRSTIQCNFPVPKAPFSGSRTVTDIDNKNLYPLMNKQALYRGRWGYRCGKSDPQEYAAMIAETVDPIFNELVQRMETETLLQPRVAYGYFSCFSKENELIVRDESQEYVFPFPRQQGGDHLCLADYFRNEKEGGDLVAFLAVTIGEELSRETRRLYEANSYHDYMMLHGFGTEITDALAEYWHGIMRNELGLAEDQGKRYAFGYPSCPDLEAHQAIFSLLKPERIGMSLSETFQMTPEQSTCAIVAHHPQSRYFMA